VTADYPWMIYGATGRAGELIARKAVAHGLRPILAGRNAHALHKLAMALNLSCRVFEFGDWARVRREISTVNLLVNAAGPLIQTSVPIAESCLAGHTHYFDLTNQVPSLVAIYTLDAEAKEKGLTLLPGLALSTAASNCLIQHLHSLLPDANDLDIVLEPFLLNHITGANLTIAENIAQSGFRRCGGFLERYPCNKWVEVDLPTGTRWMLPSALGDVEAAYRCTGLPNITTYVSGGIPAAPRGSRPRTQMHSAYSSLSVSRQIPNDLDAEDSRKQSMVWARMSKIGGKVLEGWLQFGEGREFTAALVIAGVSRLLKNKRLAAGVHTPATALGAEFILELPNVMRTVQPLQPGPTARDIRRHMTVAKDSADG
jgi:short subunit dehydrogenase-like uncharacterized protein